MQAENFLSRTAATVFSDPHPLILRLLNHSYNLESDLPSHMPPGINCILVCVTFQMYCGLSDLLSLQMPLWSSLLGSVAMEQSSCGDIRIAEECKYKMYSEVTHPAPQITTPAIQHAIPPSVIQNQALAWHWEPSTRSLNDSTWALQIVDCMVPRNNSFKRFFLP